RDATVTGVQTCALPICGAEASWSVDGATDMSRLSWLMPRLQSGDVVRVSPPAELPDGMKDLVALPLRSGGVILGGLVVATVGAERAWSDELLEQLYLVGETVANALAAGQAERESGRLRQELAEIGRVSALGELAASLAPDL